MSADSTRLHLLYPVTASGIDSALLTMCA